MNSITIRQGIPDVETYLGLRRSIGWSIPDLEAASAALANTECGFLVQRGDQTVGMATIHGDGVLYFYIQDFIIHREFQNLGYGKRLMDAVMSYINKHASEKAYVALLAAKGLENFYARYGFIPRPNDKYGAGMFFIKGGKESERDRTPHC
jgi:ribosomal protein S18 acetylase RimI-like enzyme